MKVYISSVLTPYRRGTIEIEDEIDARTVCRLVVVDADGNKLYRKGNPVTITLNDGLTTMFAGVIDTVMTSKIGATRSEGLYHDLTCTDWHYLADRRIAKDAYEAQTAGYIVNDLLTKYLADEGITAGTIQDGPTGESSIFNYVPVSQALNVLAETAGFQCWVGFDKRLHFVERSTFTAPFEIDSSLVVRQGSVRVKEAAPFYRNRQYLKGGKDITDSQVETQVGDGEAKAFVVGYPIAKVPTVEVNIAGGGWAAQTRGIKGLETGKDWYWSKSDAIIVQDQGGAPLTASDLIRISYQGEYPIVVLSWDSAAIQQIKTNEGAGTGYVEHVIHNSTVNSRTHAFDEAASKLSKYAVIGRTLELTIEDAGLEPGHLVTVDLPDYGLDEVDMLIESVLVLEEDDDVLYRIKAVEGPATGSWAMFFHRLAEAAQAFVIRENISEDQILVTSGTWPESWGWGEVITVTVNTCPLPELTTFPELTLFPC